MRVATMLFLVSLYFPLTALAVDPTEAEHIQAAELEQHRMELERELLENQEALQRIRKDEELRPFDPMEGGKREPSFLDLRERRVHFEQAPQELEGLLSEMHEAMQRMARAIEERVSVSREQVWTIAGRAEEQLHEFALRLQNARMMAEQTEAVLGVRTRAEELGMGEEMSPLIAELEGSFESIREIHIQREEFERESMRLERAQELLFKQIELRFLEGEMALLEEELMRDGHED